MGHGTAGSVLQAWELTPQTGSVFRLWRYDGPSGRMRPMEAGEIAKERLAWLSSLDGHRALDVSVTYDDRAKVLAWRLGPYAGEGLVFVLTEAVVPVTRAGSARILSDKDLEFPVRVVPVGRVGSARIHLDKDLPFHVRYDSPGGWRTQSDLLIVPVGRGQFTRVEWQRVRSHRTGSPGRR